jgi:hypothetical protein
LAITPTTCNPPLGPDRDYLTFIDEFAFWVANLEWEIVGDLRVASAEVDIVQLLGRSTGQIGHALREAAEGFAGASEHPGVPKHRCESAPRRYRARNHVMHARPAQRRDGTPMFVRLREVGGQVQRIWIDQDLLARQIQVVHYWTRRMGAARGLPPD